MSKTYRHAETPEALKGEYVVGRHWNSFDGDFLKEWDAEHGAVFTGIGGARSFSTHSEAVGAAIRCKSLFPEFRFDVGVAQ
ncbi:MAG: hypothetical protein COA62_15905 [Rhodobiaceae bacterium]|nr:MAG: hypothetical protein COA62_15905 [Rhodobiaceae bacterium]